MLLQPKTAKPASFRFKPPLDRAGFRGNDALPCPLNFDGSLQGVEAMSVQNSKLKRDMWLASAMIAAGVMLCAISLLEIARTHEAAARDDVNVAQATPPLQGTPSAPPSDTPAESKPGGTRPTTPAPEPATPPADAQKEGAKAALPSAPPEKVAPPIEQKK